MSWASIKKSGGITSGAALVQTDFWCAVMHRFSLFSRHPCWLSVCGSVLCRLLRSGRREQLKTRHSSTPFLGCWRPQGQGGDAGIMNPQQVLLFPYINFSSPKNRIWCVFVGILHFFFLQLLWVSASLFKECNLAISISACTVTIQESLVGTKTCVHFFFSF